MEHFWNFQDELLSDVCQLPDKGIQALSTHITNLITQCKFPHAQIQEMLKIIVLQHTVQYHKARDWIQLWDESQHIYQYLLAQCKLLELRWEQCQKAKEKGQADLTTITATTATASSIHTDTISTYPRCNKCGYSHPLHTDSPATYVVVTIIIQPCVSNIRSPSVHPKTP